MVDAIEALAPRGSAVGLCLVSLTRPHARAPPTGFVKYALQYGYALRPAFCFGEESTYLTLNFFERFRLKHLAGNNVPPVLFMGKYGVLPFDNHEMTVVIGPPIQSPVVENPTKEDVEKYHNLYVEGLRRVFDENKKEYATEDAKLELM